MKQIKLLATLAALLSSLALGAHSLHAEGVLKFGRGADSQFLDPVLNDSNFDIWMLNNLYDTLLVSSKDGSTLEPGLATDWQVSEDGLTVTLTIRPDVKFADGSSLQTSDIKWTLDRARNPDNGLWNEFLASIDNVELVGDDKVVLNLGRGDPAILAALASFNSSIMPEKLFMAEAGETDEDRAKAFSRHPVGTGPFLLSEWRTGSSMLLTRNPHYWAVDSNGTQLPYLDEIRVEVIPDDATRILKLQAGELDLVEHVPFSRVAELQADPGVNMVLFPSTRNYGIVVNNRKSLSDGNPNPMHDRRVRQAMNYAINKEAMLKVVFFGIGNPSSGMVPSSTPHAFPAGNVPYPYDLARAKALLAEAGYPDGFEISIDTLAGNADDVALSATLQQMWGQIGIKLEISLVDYATRFARYRQGVFDMRNVAWTNDINDPGQVVSIYAYSPTNDSFHTGYFNKEVEELYLATQGEIDTSRRSDLFQKLQTLYNEDSPIMFLVETPLPVAMRSSVEGFVQIPLGNQVFKEARVK